MIKSKLASFLKKFNAENLAKVLKSFDKGMAQFNKGVKDFGETMDSITKELSSDVSKSNQRAKRESIKNQRNVEKLFGKSNKKQNNIKIWGSSKSNVKVFSGKRTNLF